MAKRGQAYFSGQKKTLGFLKNISANLHCCCPQYMGIFKKSNLGKKLRGFEIFLHGALWAKKG